MTNNAHLPQPYDVWRLAFYFEDKPDVVKEEGVRNFVSHGIIRAPDGFTYP